MDIKLKKAIREEIPIYTEIEKGATPGLQYVEPVFDVFEKSVGEFTVAEVDGKPVGIGKLTVLYDGSAWLETLRVLPDMQGKGIGKEIYKRYFEQAKELNIPAMRMYTGFSNKASKGLAERYGFTHDGTFRGYNLTAGLTGDKGSFTLVTDSEKAWELLKPHFDYAGGYLVQNRTFYEFNEATVKGMCADNMIYTDSDGNIAVAGARFMENVALHLLFMHGDLGKCVSFAKALAAERTVPKLTMTFTLENPTVEQCLIDNGFEKERSDLITMLYGK